MKKTFYILSFALASTIAVGCKCSKSEKELTGNDRDTHGCIASAGYTWSDAKGECIRIWEVGMRLEAVDLSEENTPNCYAVFSADSSKVELFFSNGEHQQMLDRRTNAEGRSAWNIEDDDTYNLTTNNGWEIQRRGIVMYKEVKKTENEEMGI